MKYDVNTIDEYISVLPENRRVAVEKLRNIIIANLPEGFVEQMSYGMIGYVVPLSIYPKGYHVKKNEPLPFLSIASQKNHIALYHLGMYMDKAVETWFAKEYDKQVATKLDMGKSCIRFKNTDTIPYKLIAELCKKITVEDYIKIYEKTLISE